MSDASDEEPLGAKPSGVGSPLNSSRYSRPTTGSLAQTTRGPAAGGGDVFGGGARPRSNGDVLGGGGGGGDELGGGDPGGYGASYGSGGGGGGINGGSGRPQSAALNRARDLQLKKRSDRLMSQGMAVANDGGVGHLSRPLQALAQPAPPQSKPEPVPTVYAQPATLVGKPVPTVYCTAAPVPRLAAMPATMDSVDALTARDEADVPIQSFLSAETERAAPLVTVSTARGSDEPSRDGSSSTARAEVDDDLVTAPAPVSAKPAGDQWPGLAKATVPLDLSDMRAFLERPANEGPLLQCHITRSKAGFLSSYPKYTMVLQQPGGQEVALMAARKRGQSKSSNYLISLDAEDMNRDSGNYFGKLRSNFLGTEFVLYDQGLSPDKLDKLERQMKADKGTESRAELCAVLYKQNVLYTRGPRRMTVVAPAIGADGKRKALRPSKANEESSMLEKYKADEADPDLVVLKNKSPEWNDVANAYVLNFNGRVTLPSVKNFQIVDEMDEKEVVIMQFGRIGDNDFTCDFQSPLSPLQAFGIALSSFDYKIACE